MTNVVERERGYGGQFNLRAIAENIEPLVAFPNLSTLWKQPVLFIGGGDSNYIT